MVAEGKKKDKDPEDIDQYNRDADKQHNDNDDYDSSDTNEEDRYYGYFECYNEIQNTITIKPATNPAVMLVTIWRVSNEAK